MNKFTPISQFLNNRAHGCYYGFCNENAQGLIADQVFPRIEVTDTATSQTFYRPVVSTFEDVTATGNRYLGFRMRPE